MTLNTGASDNDDLSSIPVDPDLYRQLMQQFYESSIRQYGIDSEQSQMLKAHLSAHAGDAG